MALVLTRCKFQATYDPATETFIVGDAYEGANGLSTALINAGITDFAGSEVYLTVQYADRSPNQDPNKRAAFEVGIYERLANGRLKRKGTLETSSSGNAAVAWSPLARELVMQSTLAGSFINQLSLALPVYQRGLVTTGTDYSTTLQTLQRMSDDLLVTPTNADTRLSFNISGYYRVRATQSGIEDIRCRLLLEINDDGNWVPLDGASYFFGDTNFDSSKDRIIYFSPNLLSEVNQSKLNTNGDWQIRLAGEVDYLDNQLNSYFTKWSYEEFST